ncbi:hypothetical protein H8N03_20690 [Ramlibacter sp. USB13]|uniref:Peptidase M15A C-terminal domain-containing protein n=1 Tax=Ramlibacter cellulosilyticus TaxID=2764187 RepID=A0A923MX78_9BURK|nr:hypothetical protein [Ramlibacter cellulosilyticus]MBC5785377.1 hypothetical protein [Ramlibacter cellulosilyticus]
MTTLPLPLVLPGDLPREWRQVLRPGETLRDRSGIERVLPSSFLRVDSWHQALETDLTVHFKAWELIGVDVRETLLARSFPRYVPCAILLLAGALELFRLEVGTYVHVAANGGYRSPAHALSRHASRHCWGTAANIYRIGDTYLDNREEIEKYAAIARRVIPGAWIRPWGQEDGEADDHLHIDIGYTLFDPVDVQDASQPTEES